MSFDYHTLAAPELHSGNLSDSDYFSELNSAKSNRPCQRSSSLPGHKAQPDAVSDILPLGTYRAAARRSWAEVDSVFKVK